MKFLASRTETDTDDIRFLYQRCGFSTVEEGLDLLQRAYPRHRIEVKTQYLLAEIVETLHG